MNTFKKIGLTALATSLVASSAYSAEVTMSGAAGLTWSTQSGNSGAAADHGKGVGQDNSISFSMSGELDNGWSVAAGTALTDAFALSSNNVKLTMGDWGTVMTGTATGGNGGSFDGNTPNAYEEVDDGGASSLSTNLLGSTHDTGGLHWTLPAMDLGGMAVQAYLGYTHTANACPLFLAMLQRVLSRMCAVFLALSISVSMRTRTTVGTWWPGYGWVNVPAQLDCVLLGDYMVPFAWAWGSHWKCRAALGLGCAGLTAGRGPP
jgi:hypothetical protein